MSSDGSGDRVEAASGRPSAVSPEIKLERRVGPWFGFLCYGFLFAAAWIWTTFSGVTVASLWTPRNLLLEIGVGLGAGLILVGATPFAVSRVGALRELEREFGWILGEQRAWECVYLALLSGVAEEFFFRGAMLQAMSDGMQVIVFAALHWPVNAQFRAWPLTALLAGVILTAEYRFTGTLVAPAITHVLVNAVNLLRISRKYRVWKE